MSKHYGDIAFTDHVQEVQDRYGSKSVYSRRLGLGGDALDPITTDVAEFLSDRDSFYVSTVGETGWPYVQYRGGPPGFLQTLDEHTLGWADFRGNRQYISTGNVATDDRMAIFVMNYAQRRRLKLFGHARVVFAEDDPQLVASLAQPAYEAVVERAVLVTVAAYDWNCSQHITPRYTIAELELRLAATRHRISALEAENEELRRLLAGPA
jgi:predicted pyridoxine 5'-phosphate oxidase superfamily flavin-nucleotide-binding protein